MLAAYFRDRWPDAVLRVFAILCYATPVFFAGLLLKLVFAVWLQLASGRRARHRTGTELHAAAAATADRHLPDRRPPDRQPGAVIGDVLQHAVLPGLALGLLTAGIFLRLVRTNVIGTLGTRLRRRGPRRAACSEFRLVRKHAYRPALIPIITVIGLQIALLLGGAVLTETTFEWKGLGFQLAQYLTARDFVAVQGIVALLAVIVALTNFIVDIIAALIDPRVRY